MEFENPARRNWNDVEIDLIINDYFAMLRLELSKTPFNKAEHNRTLRTIVDRSHKSIEFKHRNISAVLDELGMPWIIGYKPARNFQNALTDGVDRFLASTGQSLLVPQSATMSFAESNVLFFEQPPQADFGDAPLPDRVARLVRKIDFAARDERNRTLGEQGEERIYNSERQRLHNAGFANLAKRVKWVSKEDGDGAGYDIRSYDVAGRERLLEVKTTQGRQRTPFYLSRNEHDLSLERPDDFRIVRLYDFARKPRVFELEPPLSELVILEPESYRASFG